MEETKTLDKIIKALYESISGPAGQIRAWEMLRNIFFPGAHLIRTSINEDGLPEAKMMDVESFIKETHEYFLENGFFEWEISRQVQRFGNISHVLSTYESRRDPEDKDPFNRGINSIQLFHDGNRWWVMNMIWDYEREDNPLPDEYR